MLFYLYQFLFRNLEEKTERRSWRKQEKKDDYGRKEREHKGWKSRDQEEKTRYDDLQLFVTVSVIASVFSHTPFQLTVSFWKFVQIPSCEISFFSFQ